MDPLDYLREKALAGDKAALDAVEVFAEVRGMDRLRADLAKRFAELAKKYEARPEAA